MATEWKKIKLTDFMEFNPALQIKKKSIAKKIPMEMLLPFTRKISGYELAEFKGGSKFQNGDTLLARITPCLENGKTAFVNILEENEIAFGSTEFIVLRAKKGISDPAFIYYFVTSPFIRDIAIKSMVGSSGRQRVQQTVLENLEVDLPPLETQQKIAKILSALDEKIELNNKINENLHAQAQAIFKSWFVDFEPFGGTMPNDWGKTDIYHYANIIYGAPFASKLFNTEKKGRPLLRIRDLKNQEPSVFTEQVHPKEYLLQQGDIVAGMDGEFKPYLWAGEEVLLNQRVCVFQNKRPLGKVFLYFSVAPQLDLIEKTEMATTVIHIGKSDFEKFEFLLPNENVLSEFDKLTAPYFELMVKNVKENKRLAQIRDTLLPKLMSGELEV